MIDYVKLLIKLFSMRTMFLSILLFPAKEITKDFPLVCLDKMVSDDEKMHLVACDVYDKEQIRPLLEKLVADEEKENLSAAQRKQIRFCDSILRRMNNSVSEIPVSKRVLDYIERCWNVRMTEDDVIYLKWINIADII